MSLMHSDDQYGVMDRCPLARVTANQGGILVLIGKAKRKMAVVKCVRLALWDCLELLMDM